MSARPTWIDQRTDVMLIEIQTLGLAVPRTVAADIVRTHVAAVADRMRVTERSARPYVTDDALKELAQQLAFSLVEEAPGADFDTAPRTASITIELAGRAVAGLAEATQVRLHVSRDADDIRVETAPLTQALSALGQLIRDAPDNGPVMSPPFLLRRISRYLDVAAEHVRQGVLPTGLDPSVGPGLADAFERDATKLRSAAGPPQSNPT